MEQYSNINKQQHFGSTNVSEEWYIQNIINFIQEAKAGLPEELKNIIKDSVLFGRKKFLRFES